jgi:hypothetical protein
MEIKDRIEYLEVLLAETLELLMDNKSMLALFINNTIALLKLRLPCIGSKQAVK